jgi:hypothetical protein
MKTYNGQIQRSICLIVSLIIATGVTTNAQNGIYRTLEDFEKNKLTYTTRNDSVITKIRFNEFIARPYIIFKRRREKTLLFKDDIYAYKKKGNIVRVWNFTSYCFLEKGPIWIYYKDVYVSQPKGLQRERQYFYSINGNAPIQQLTVYNLKQSFADNYQFHLCLDAQFRSDTELAHYDNYGSKYKVNQLLEITGEDEFHTLSIPAFIE